MSAWGYVLATITNWNQFRRLQKHYGPDHGREPRPLSIGYQEPPAERDARVVASARALARAGRYGKVR